MPSDLDLEQYLPGASAIEVSYRDDATIGVLLVAGDNAPFAPLAASEVTPGMSALLADPRPLGKGAQTVLGAQLGASAADTDPVKLTTDDVFEGNPLPVL